MYVNVGLFCVCITLCYCRVIAHTLKAFLQNSIVHHSWSQLALWDGSKKIISLLLYIQKVSFTQSNKEVECLNMWVELKTRNICKDTI